MNSRLRNTLSLAFILCLLLVACYSARINTFAENSGGNSFSNAQSVELGKNNSIRIKSVGLGKYFKFKTTGNGKTSYVVSSTSNYINDYWDDPNYGHFCITLYDSNGNEVDEENTWDVEENGRPYTRTYTKLRKNAYYYVCIHGMVEDDDIFVNAQLKISEKVPKPGRTKINRVKSGKRKITLKYKKISYASKYQIAYKKTGTKRWITKTTTKRTYTIKKLKRGKKYQIKVRAIRIASGKKYYGKYSPVKTIKVK